MLMQSTLNWQTTTSGERVKRLMSERYFWLMGVAVTFLFALETLLFWRRLAGAIHEPLSMWGIVASGIFLILLAGITRSVGRFFLAKENTPLLSELALSFALFAVAATLTMPGTSVAGLSVFWLILLAEEGFAWRTRIFRVPKGLNNPAHFREGDSPTEPQKTSIISAEPLARQEPQPPKLVDRSLESVEALPEEVTQQITRSTAADGAEELAGWLRIPFLAGQRTGSVHLAFCPPFARTPELTVEQIDGPESRIKTAQLLPYGARLDLKLHASGEAPTGVVVQFSARSENQKPV